MGEQLALGAQDRVLVIAPHPDDESIATGGLLQSVRAAGAALRLLVLTDGDNNPWPQRWIEKRWRIDTAARARWGARRRAEAHAALRVLGIDAGDVRFFGLPDLGLTDLLMRADGALMTSLRGQLDEFAPTLLVFPALADRHPDHNAAHVLLRCALARSAIAPRLLTFAVHGASPAPGQVAVALDQQRRALKQAAILAHATQMQFSRRRFLAFAGEQENYQSAGSDVVEEAAHPLHARIAADRLQVRLDLARLGKAPTPDDAVFVVLEHAGGSARWLLGPGWDSTQAERRALPPACSAGRAADARAADPGDFRRVATAAGAASGLCQVRAARARLARLRPLRLAGHRNLNETPATPERRAPRAAFPID